MGDWRHCRGDPPGAIVHLEMLAESMVEVRHPYKHVMGVLSDPNRNWLVGGDFLAMVGIRVAGVPAYRRVRVTIGPPVRLSPNRSLVPLEWIPDGATGSALLPALEGILKVEAINRFTTLIRLRAIYSPPWGNLGELLDRALMHRLAALTVRDFVEQVAASVSRRLAVEPSRSDRPVPVAAGRSALPVAVGTHEDVDEARGPKGGQ